MSVWPSLPPEGLYSEMERRVIDASPDGLWPDNQDSNFGQLRAVTIAPMQDILDLLDLLSNEMFVQTALRYLSLWEEEVGLPSNPEGQSVENRRASVLSRLQKGPFTRTRRRDIVRRFIQAFFGPPIALVPEGVPIPPEGLGLFAEGTSVDDLFIITEEVENFHFTVIVDQSVGIDIDGLSNALDAVMYAGLSFTVIYGDVIIGGGGGGSTSATLPGSDTYPATDLYPGG
jgi:hypothetical protein